MKMTLGQDSVYQLLLVFVFVVFCAGGYWKESPQESAQMTSQFRSGEEKPEFNIEANGLSAPLPQQPINCETALLALDDAIIKVREMKDTYLIIIARSGEAEKSSRLNDIRLNVIEKSYLKRFPDVKYVTATGKRAKGFGQIEIYVGGKQLYVLPIKNNAKTFCPEPI